MKQVVVTVPEVPGNKAWVCHEDGLYVLAVGPGILAGIFCASSAGSSGLRVFDGTVDKQGFLTEPARELFSAWPAVPGAYPQLGCGFGKGLVVSITGHPVATITWTEQPSVKKTK